MMKSKELRKKTTEELNAELLKMFREQFNLRMKIKSKQLKKTHLLKTMRHNISRVKTILTEKKSK